MGGKTVAFCGVMDLEPTTFFLGFDRAAVARPGKWVWLAFGPQRTVVESVPSSRHPTTVRGDETDGRAPSREKMVKAALVNDRGATDSQWVCKSRQGPATRIACLR